MSESEAHWMSDGYEQCYYTGSLGRMWAHVHKLLERPFSRSQSFDKVLELGAGQGQHLQFVKHSYNDYWLTDLRSDLVDQEELKDQVHVLSVDAQSLHQFADQSFDRLIATCLLVHLRDPLSALQEWRRVVKANGWLSIYVPLEPSLANRVARRLFIWPKSRRHGAEDPEFLMYFGHQIHYIALKVFMHRVFALDRVVKQRFPSRFIPWNFGLFEIWHVQRRNDAEVAHGETEHLNSPLPF